MISSQIPMRRFENGTRDPKMIAAILDQINIVHVGCFDDKYPYVVPLSFGYEITDGKLLVYLHGAKEGHKIELWKKNPHVALTFSTFYNHPDRKYKGCMHDFRSVMALGTIAPVNRKTQGELNGRSVQSILRHNDRKPNQFSVPHYMWMGIYVVTCDLKDVVGKFENPIEDPCDVPFPDVYSIPENNEPYDCEYFYHKKAYKPFALNWKEINAKAEMALPDELEIIGTSADFSVTWLPNDPASYLDFDLSALLLNEKGVVSRRYDMVFYNQVSAESGAVIHRGDDILSNHLGSETIHVDFNLLGEHTSEIIFLLSAMPSDGYSPNMSDLNRVELQISFDCNNRYLDNNIYSIDTAQINKPAFQLFSLKLECGKWCLRKKLSAMTSWKILDQAKEYGLLKWKE